MEFASASAQETNQWSSAHGFILERVFAILKQRRRWIQDGKSLRRLNKHWCLEIGKQIVSINPPNGRVIEDVGAQAILKFPNLTALNIVPFCRRSRFDVSSEKCSSMMTVLHQLPHLIELKMTCAILSRIKEDEIEGLVCKTIKVDGQTVDSNNLLKLSAIPIEEIVVVGHLGTGSLEAFIAATPSLKRMCRTIDSFPDNSEVDRLNSLDAVEIEYQGNDSAKLSALSSTVSLDIRQPVHSIEPFKNLRQLKKLDISVGSSDIFTEAFWCLMSRLTHLTMLGYEEYVDLSSRFWEMTTGLEVLKLRSFIVNPSVFLNHNVGNLLRLTLDGCKVDCESIPYSSLGPLTPQHEMSNVGRDGERVRDHLVPKPNKGLKELTVKFRYTSKSLHEDLFHFICQLKSLESLELLEIQAQHRSDGFPHSGFEELRTLPCLSRVVINGRGSQETIDKLSQSHLLDDIDHIDIAMRRQWEWADY